MSPRGGRGNGTLWRDFKVGAEEGDSISVRNTLKTGIDTQANTGDIFFFPWTGGDYMLRYNATHYRLWRINYMPLS